MKKLLALLCVGVMCISICACSNSKNKVLVSESWVNVYDGDVYTFTSDGNGTHDDVNITFKREEGTVLISEGATNVTPMEYTLSDETEPVKLIAPDKKTYYVRKSEYDTIAEQLKKENTEALTSTEFWKSTSETSYMQFFEGGSGWLLVPGDTFSIKWEWVDNNTIKAEMLDLERSTTLDVVNTDGKWSLCNPEGKALWVPKS